MRLKSMTPMTSSTMRNVVGGEVHTFGKDVEAFHEAYDKLKEDGKKIRQIGYNHGKYGGWYIITKD